MNKLAAISSWSGGKDSCYAYFKAIKAGCEVKYLLNFTTRGTGRGCFHGIEGRLMRRQASLLGVPLVQREVSPDMRKYEEEFKEAVSELKINGIGAMVFGDIYLLEHASWVDRVCKDLAITPVEPLWNLPAARILEEFLDLGFKAIIVSCQAEKLGKEFIGRCLEKSMIKEFEDRGVCPCGENGEFHTLVVDGPIFKEPIKILESETIFKEGFWKHWFLDIKRYE
ncbi:MAG: diphthine--ammonia ligase [Candidatus Omnitrophica bacterium]|nr:diphthine--ammonia ligase [Candidatus Omnitrophota bacterium]